jgi:hypothetical protein
MNDVVVNIDIAELRVALRNDVVTVLAFYLKDELDLEVPQLHEEIWDELLEILDQVNSLDFVVGHLQKLFCVPRGHAKSTITKLAVILFLRYSRFKFALYASLTAGIAKNAIKDIIAWLTSEDDERVWGTTRVIKSNESEQLWILEIGIPGNLRKRVIMKALGADQQVRGTLIDNMRPEILVIDDCEDYNTASDEKTQAKHDNWFFGALLKATAKRSVRIMLGNMINKRTALYRLSQDKAWNPTVYGAIIRDKATGKLRPLWEGLYTLESLLTDYADHQAKGIGHIWVYEMMNMTADTVFKTIMHSALRPSRPVPDQVNQGIIILDPAFGENAYNDYSAFTVHVKTPDSHIPILVDHRVVRCNEDKLLDVFLELSYYWNLTCWGIETQAAQKLLIPLFRAKLEAMGIPTWLFEMIGLQSGGKAKASRILAFVNSVAMGSYAIALEEEEVFQSLTNYDPTQTKEKDDLPDSAAYGTVVWAEAGSIIENNGLLQQRMALMSDNSEGVYYNELQTVPF